LLDRIRDRFPGDALVLGDPLHLMYFAGFHVDPFSLGADYGGLLVIRRDGHATLFHDNRVPKSTDTAHADERQVVPWYDGQTPGQGPRRLAVARGVFDGAMGRVHDHPCDHLGGYLIQTIAELRRQKDTDELALLGRCMQATDAGHAWALANIRPGMTELDVYNGVVAACNSAAGQAVIVYGDFAVSPGPERRGGPATHRVLQDGDMFILDYSVVIGGYRSDFTNTLVAGRQPNSGQKALYDSCMSAMAAGELELRAGASCRAVYEAVRGSFARDGMAEHFPHHAGHGLGLSHPESPFFVRHANETLLANDVVTLEPGLYVAGVGGIRIEHNYRITETGFERLSHHKIALQ
jgi:Xaa-Pro aminopeptidase